MTVIAWDGTTLAADRQATCAGLTFSVTKIRRVGDYLVGVSGNMAHAGRYLAWFEAGRVPDAYPAQAERDDDLCYLFAVHRSGTLERFEQTGWPVVIEEAKHATGSGRDFAMAVLHLGFDAVRAVEVASALCGDCGRGVDVLTFAPETAEAPATNRTAYRHVDFEPSQLDTLKRVRAAQRECTG